ncbi:protein of unknown function [Zobellia uliginosa]|uniref:PoNi C-terminal domain-containing protein n=1 Tax=Zobellia uliginosa TaxID=143224 RepID=A0ABY1L457_9FLAO|nr:PoNe immunity protein domain-containing protein [Zobellia uliginosa]SIT01162.1 protein of unknown function [Zobellia uliginosa]
MKLRDKLNTKDGYQEIISNNQRFIHKRDVKIKKLKEDEKKGIQSFPKPNTEILRSTYKTIIDYKCEILKAQYSLGESLSKIEEEFVTILTFANENNILVSYANLNVLLCMGVMFEINDQEFEKMVNIAEHYLNLNGESDYLMDFLIKNRIPDRKLSGSFILEKPYGDLKKIIDCSEKDKEQALKLLKDYLEKTWYKELIEVETHKSKFNIHTGYWSWEAGAIAKILALDDSSLKNQQYYPYDMVHWKD